MGETLHMKKFTSQNTEKQMLACDHSRTANFRTKILATFPGIFGVFHGILKCWCLYSTSSRGKPTDVLWNLVGQHCFGVRQLHKHRPILTLRLLMSYIYGAPSKARNANVVYIYIYLRLATLKQSLFAAQCFNTESMHRGFLCHICV